MSGKPYILNPDTIGYTIKHVYLPEGIFKIYKNNIFESSGNYWFDKIIYPDGPESDLRLFTQKDDYIRSAIFQIKEDTLYIDNTEEDDAKRVFTRIK